MRRVVFDTNAVDPLADEPGVYTCLKNAVVAGELEILYTHVTIDELVAVPDVDRRSRLVLLVVDVGHLVPTGTMAADYSRIDFCRVGGDEQSAEDAWQALRSRNINHTPDALIASTALYEKCALVTNEHRLAGRARELGIETLTTLELAASVGWKPDGTKRVMGTQSAQDHPKDDAARTADLVRLISALLKQYTELAGNLIEYVPKQHHDELSAHVEKIISEVTDGLKGIVASKPAPPAGARG